MAIPPLLYQFAPANVRDYLRSITGAPSAAFTPQNLMNTMIANGIAYDAGAGYHLRSQGGSARRVQITDYGTAFALWGIETVQTVAGAAEMVSQTMMHPALLREMVTSPGGTTVAGLAELEKAGLRSAVMDAVRAATERSRELGAARD